MTHHSEAVAGDLNDFAHGTPGQTGCQSRASVAFVADYADFHGPAVFGDYNLRDHAAVRKIDELNVLCRLMKAEMAWQVDIRQVRPHQIEFVIGCRQQHFVCDLLSRGIGPLVAGYSSKIFSAHVRPEWRRSALPR